MSGDKLRSPHVSWVFAQLVTFPIFGRGATCPPYDLKSQKGQIEGIIRFYAASATCQGDKLKWTPTCQGTNCGARMFAGFFFNLLIFLSSAGGQLVTFPISGPGATWGWPSQSRLRRASVSAAASVGRWATSHRDVAAPKGEPSLASPFGGRWCPVGTVQRLVSAAASVGDGRSPLGCITRAGRREWPRVSEDGEGKLPASPAAPVAIALAGACAVNCNCSLPVAGFFLADTH